MNWLRMWIRAFVEAIQGHEPQRLKLRPVLEDGPLPGWWFVRTWSDPEWVRCKGCGKLQLAKNVALDACPECQEVKR